MIFSVRPFYLAFCVFLAGITGAAGAQVNTRFDGTWAGTVSVCSVTKNVEVKVENGRFVYKRRVGNISHFEGQIDDITGEITGLVTKGKGYAKGARALKGRVRGNKLTAKGHLWACWAEISLTRAGPSPSRVASARSAGAALEQRTDPRQPPRVLRSAPVATTTDRAAPVITLPGSVKTDKAMVELAGSVADASTVVEVSVNGIPVELGSDGSFKIRRAVAVGKSELRVTALDEWGNRIERTIAITRSLVLGSLDGEAAAQSPTAETFPDVDFGRYYALVIGNNDYEFLPGLETAKADARAVATVLHERYGFEIELVMNGTREDILRALSKMRKRLTKSDNLLVYYAGHGIVDEAAGRGYWLPTDAEPDFKGDWISNADLTDSLRALDAAHVMVVADSCYSGTLVRAAPATVKGGGDRSMLIKRLAGKRSRTVLTSGGLEPVLDGGGSGHSVFAQAFLDTLNANNQVIEGQHLFAELRQKVVLNADQTPEYAIVRKAGHDGGDFIFVPR